MFFFHYNDSPLLVINTDDIDFIHNESDYQDILYEINQHTVGTRYYIPHKIEDRNMGIFRLLILTFIGYFFYRMVKRFIIAVKQNPHVQGKSKKSSDLKNRNDIQDIDYEDVE